MIEIEPATVSMVRSTDEGDLIAIDDDVQGVAAALREIDAGLRVAFDRVQEYFVIRREYMLPDGSVNEDLVTTAMELDQRIVHRMKKIADEGYDYGAELDRLEASAAAAQEAARYEETGEAAERLASALSKDLGLGGSRAFIGGGKDE